jgi:hypothetical protein
MFTVAGPVGRLLTSLAVAVYCFGKWTFRQLGPSGVSADYQCYLLDRFSSISVRDAGCLFFPSRIPDPGVKSYRIPDSQIRI